jgi:hypothetical protein
MFMAAVNWNLLYLCYVSVIPQLVVLDQSAVHSLRTTGVVIYIISHHIMVTAVVSYASSHIFSSQIWQHSTINLGYTSLGYNGFRL